VTHAVYPSWVVAFSALSDRRSEIVQAFGRLLFGTPVLQPAMTTFALKLRS
jgi:hypothetical protein